MRTIYNTSEEAGQMRLEISIHSDEFGVLIESIDLPAMLAEAIAVLFDTRMHG